MSSFKRFWKAIADATFASPARVAAITRLDPEHIYVENVRSILGVNTWLAKRFCETAVRQGFFAKRVQVLCPKGAVGAEAATERDLPDTLDCWDEVDGFFEQVTVPTGPLPKLEFYILQRGGAA